MLRFVVIVSITWTLALGASSAHAEDSPGYGHVTGRFLYDGEPPEPKVFVRKGDPLAKDAPCCAKQTIYDESLVVDRKSKGIANIFVYLRKALETHPDLKATPQSDVMTAFDGCRMVPHALFARTKQNIRWRAKDACLHNPHDFAIKNPMICQAIPPGGEHQQAYEISESVPFPVKCDIHPWMKAWWLILDHPYAAITDSSGRFRIDKLPAGDHEFLVWHERRGYVEKKLRVTISPDATTDLGERKLDPKIFEK